jgi:tripartite-type tricarboxylate transporter receptor subunit TctC
MKRRSLLGAAMMLPAASVLQAQGTFPSAPIRIIVPLGAGGVYDTIARSVAKDLARQFNVPVIVENKPGGNYVIGMRAVSTAKPDGYTIGLSAGTILSQTPIIFPEVTYKLEDFAPVAPLMSVRNVLAVNAASPVKNLADFVRLARASSKPTLLATTGVGSVSHLSVLQLAKTAGFEIEAVPFKSNPAALQAIMGGHMNRPGF